MPGSPLYITTPIFYVNDKPHIGHVYTSTMCDVWARHMRLTGGGGGEVFFLSGTDEHGLKVEKSALARQIHPKALADENAAEFRRALAAFAISNNDFIRTTDARHERQVQRFISRLLDSGAIYLGQFEGWYDEGQEEYYTETKAKELDYTSPVSKKPLARATENNYYFRLSAYQGRLEEHFAQHPDFVRPEGRRNEVLGRLRDGLQDVPISRTNFTWGIPMPNDPAHVVYVWVDALFNYITALGLGEEGGDSTRRSREKFWPATYHVIGKEILWFHAIIWPALLMALDLPLPRCIYAHSFWIAEGQKMSKSLGNFIDQETLDRYIATYGLDALRYYLATQGPLGSQDANFSATHFHKTYSDDLVNTVGNCASRVTAMLGRYFDGTVPAAGDTTRASGFESYNIRDASGKAVGHAQRAMEQFDLSSAITAAVSLIRTIDGYINATEPFKIAKDPAQRDRLASILYDCIEGVRIASLLLWPTMPEKMQELWRALNLESSQGLESSPFARPLAEVAAWGGMKPGTAVSKVALFPRVEQSV